MSEAKQSVMGAGERCLVMGILQILLLAMWPVTEAAASNAIEVPNVTARAVYAFDPATGEVILELNPLERLPIGSVTKVATALVVVDHLDFDDEIVIASDDMVPDGYSSMGLQPGDTLTVEHLLTGLIVASGGDAAQALARTVGNALSGSDDPGVAMAAFVEAMNAELAVLGLADTRFANPDGADSPDAWSTAHDVAHLYAAYEKHSALAEFAAQTSYSFTSVGPEQTLYEGYTTNELAGQHNIIGVKTGSETNADGCVVLSRSANVGGGTEIVAILGADLEYDDLWNPIVDSRWDDAVAVMEAIDANWTPGQNLLAEATEVATETPALVADAPVNRPQPVPQRAALAATARETSRSEVESLLVLTVTGGVLAVASVLAWSRVVPGGQRFD